MATMAGYRQVVMCTEVRDEIEAVIGAGAAVKDMLLAMCDRRLVPTPWLNRVRPLVLADAVSSMLSENESSSWWR